MTTIRGVIATVLLAWAAQLPPAAPLPRDGVSRDTSATPAATGIIRGRVTNRESGQPLARVMVVLVPGALGEEPDQPPGAGARFEPRITVTGADGQYGTKQVAAGAYVVSFEPPD